MPAGSMRFPRGTDWRSDGLVTNRGDFRDREFGEPQKIRRRAMQLVVYW